ncbi:MAG: radical SAM protein [Deltaproteobacteria bacterium]|nr:radical SAM protein [Deltaproteobacteria bacterium]
MRDAFLERTLGGPAPRSSAAQVPAPRASSATSRFARVSIAAVQREALVAALGLDPGQVRRLLGGLGELQVEVAAGTLTLTPAGSVRTPAARTDAFDLDGPADPVTAVAPLLRAVEREHPERLPRLFAPMQERPPEARLEAALAGEKVEELVRVTMACNQRCLFCSVDPRHERSHDPDTVRAFIRGRAGGPFIVFSGGEPTLDQRLPGYLRLARDAGYPDIVLQTNALRCAYPAYARKLAESGLRSAFVSLHSHLAKVSDGLTRTPGTFDLTLRGIDALLGAGVMVWLNFVATARNVTGAAEFVRFAQGRFAGLAGICFSLMAPVGVGGRVPTLWPRLRVAGPSFAAALRAATMAGIPAKVPEVCGLPLCLLPGLERFSEALRSLPADAPAQPDRTHVAACARCRWRPVCSGYWKVYLARHGEAEIVACQGPTPG